MPIPFTTVDVFTDTPFTGNQLAIVPLQDELSNDKMQRIAKEFNYSETIFIHPQIDNTYRVNIFTPFDELPFAGHPTIGAAGFVLGDVTSSKSATLITNAGPIPVQKFSNGITKASIPHNVHIHKRTINDLQHPIKGLSTNEAIAEAEKKAPIVSIVKGMSFALIELPSIELLGKVQNSAPPLDMSSLLDPEWKEGNVGKYYYVFTDKLTIRTRMIYLDILEDPATGSAACSLASYLSIIRGQSQDIQITQGVEIGRKSSIGVEVEIENDVVKSVFLSGKSVKIMEGNLLV